MGATYIVKMSRNAAETAMAMAAERLAEFKKLESTFGAEPQNGSMLRIYRDIGGRVYTYAAIRAGNGAWYMTGRDGDKARTWDDVLELFSGWTFIHYEVVPAPADQILPPEATYPCGHTDAEHVEMSAPGDLASDLIARAEAEATTDPLSFLDFLRSTGADVLVGPMPSLVDLFGGPRPDVPAEPVAVDEDGDDEDDTDDKDVYVDRDDLQR